MQKAAARGRSLAAAKRMLEHRAGRRVLRKLLRGDPRFGAYVRAFSAQAPSLLELFDDPNTKRFRATLSNERISELANALAQDVEEANSMSVGEEVQSLFSATAAQKGVMYRLGLTGEPPMTLQEAGERVGLTRERIRQVQDKVEVLFRETKPYTPALDRALRLIEGLLREGIDSVVVIASRLSAASVLKGTDTLEQVLRYAELKGISDYTIWQNEVISFLVRTNDMDGIVAASKCVRNTAVEQTKVLGACSVDALTHALEDAGLDKWTCKVTGLLGEVVEVEWLDDGRWFRVRRRDALATYSRKILSVSPTIRISDLRKGLMRSHRIKHVPPKQILGQILLRDLADLALEFDGETICAAKPNSPEDVLASLEYAIYKPLRENGGVMSRAALEAAVKSKIKLGSFHVTIGYGPIFECYLKGVYGLRGIPIAPGLVESIAPKAANRERADKDFGHLADGRIWLVQRLSEFAVDHHNLTCPAALRPYLFGTYSVSMGDSLTHYEASISSNQIRLRKNFFAALGVEPGDYALFLFDSSAHVVNVSFGDENVAEKLLAPLDEDTDSEAGDSYANTTAEAC